MKKYSLLLILIFTNFISAQDIELKNPKLIQYYNYINQAEINIIKDKLSKANNFYELAFKTFKFPQAKDLYNSLIVSLKLKKNKEAFNKFHKLECLNYTFKENFITKNFGNLKKIEKKDCNNIIDIDYKKKLDSLFEIDQYYRNISNRNYKKFQKEITKNDSIASKGLYELIQKKGFPNEYNIGLGTSNSLMYHKFYYIIWHQLATNLYSSQKVNFSDEISKALNNGKIRPDIAAQLIELNNGNLAFSSFHFKIFSFNEIISSLSNKEKEEIDCCYISKYSLKENRDQKFDKSIEEINIRRKKIGLGSLEEELKKNIYNIEKKEYIFSVSSVTSFNFDEENSKKNFKEPLIKIK